MKQYARSFVDITTGEIITYIYEAEYFTRQEARYLMARKLLEDCAGYITDMREMTPEQARFYNCETEY